MAPTLEASFGQKLNLKQQQQQQHQEPQATVICKKCNLQHHSLARSLPSAGSSSSSDEDENTQNVNPFELMLRRLEMAFSRTDSTVDVDEIWRVLEDYKTNSEDWNKYAYYDRNKYKRNLVAEYEKFNVMIICWGPGTRSCIHDHSGAHCFMKMLDGELRESRFAWPDENSLLGNQTQEMCHLSDARMSLNDVHYINDKVGLHLVENPSPNKFATSLHVYIPPYRKCKAFDQWTGQARECSLTFYSKCGRVLKEDENS